MYDWRPPYTSKFTIAPGMQQLKVGDHILPFASILTYKLDRLGVCSPQMNRANSVIL